eukprot:gb/GEZN01000023.1/.p1 GENE.gb/GEZN01000023.1/~~gb/GEZN01000023.1/.p1  ORF type:complete len:3002 (+),score=452.29 gb/GEZN01000023.1/:3365-12370(+)
MRSGDLLYVSNSSAGEEYSLLLATSNGPVAAFWLTCATIHTQIWLLETVPFVFSPFSQHGPYGPYDNDNNNKNNNNNSENNNNNNSNGEGNRLFRQFQIQRPAGISDAKEHLLVSLSVFSGAPLLVLSASSTPSDQASVLTWSAQGNSHYQNLAIPLSTLPAGPLYLSVMLPSSSTSSSFSLVFSRSSSAVVLSAGVPQAGYLDFGTIAASYHFPLYHSTPLLSICLSPLSGDPDLFVRLTPTNPASTIPVTSPSSLPCPSDFPPASSSLATNSSSSPAASPSSSFCWSAERFGADGLQIENPLLGVYEVFVRPKLLSGPASWSLVSKTQQDSQVLQEGVGYTEHLVGSATETRYTYYQLNIDRLGPSLTITATTLSGEAQLYYSSSIPLPGPSQFDYQTPSVLGIPYASTDSIVVPPAAVRLGPSYVAVATSSPCVLVLSFSLDTPVVLSLGVPQTGLVPHQGYRFFSLTTHALFPPSQQDRAPLSFVLTPHLGSVDLYVGLGQDGALLSNAQYTWRGNNPGEGSDQLTLSVLSHPPLCLNTTCSYTLAVFGLADCSFSISAGRQGGNTAAFAVLREGVPVTDAVGQGEYAYFRFTTPSSNLSQIPFVLALTELSGDPDLFAAPAAVHPYPTALNNTYSSKSFGSDSLVVLSEPDTEWSVGVFAFLSARFTMVASARPEGIQLVPGTPQGGSLFLEPSAGHSVFLPFFFDLDMQDAQEAALIFQLTTQFGDADLFINGPAAGGVTKSPLTEPSPAGAELKAEGQGSKQLTVPNARSGRYFLRVYAQQAGECSFALSVLTKAPQQGGASPSYTLQTLLDGQPVSTFLSNHSYRSYLIALPAISEPEGGEDLTISITTSSGHPDLFISWVDSRPGLESDPNTTIMAEAINDQAITIPDPKAKSLVWYVSVYANSDIRYQLVAHWQNRPWLLQGVAQHAKVLKGGWRYFRFAWTLPHPDVSGESPLLTVSLTAREGDPVLYLSPGNTPPSLSVFARTSQTGYSSTSITLHSSDPEYAGGRQPGEQMEYAIGVYGNTEASFSLLFQIAANGSYTFLQDGVPVSGNAVKNVWSFYAFQLDQVKDLAIALTALTGDPDIFVNKNTVPTDSENGFLYKSNSVGSDSLTVAGAIPGLWFVGVKAFSNASFTLLLSTNSSTKPTRLTDGVPQAGRLDPKSYHFYSFKLTNPNAPLRITVTAELGDPDLYVSLREEEAALPSIDSFQWSAMRYGQDSIIIQHPVVGEYSIAVFSAGHSQYHVSAKTEAHATLQLGVAADLNLAEGQTLYYKLTARDREALTVVLTTRTGDPDMYLSYRTRKPNETSYQWKATEIQDDALTLSKDEVLSGEPLFIAVSSVLGPATGSLLASQQPLVRLSDGVPQSGHVLREETKYYLLRSKGYEAVENGESSGGDPIVFTVSPSQGIVALWVSVGVEPSSSNHTWSAIPGISGVASLRILPSDPLACKQPSCDYYVGVTGVSAGKTSYSLTASGTSVDTLLTDGMAMQAQVTAGNWDYFRFTCRAGAEVTFAITANSGDPDMFLQAEAQPTLDEWDYRSLTFGSDSVTALPLDIDVDWYVGVFCFEACSFSVLATTDGAGQGGPSGPTPSLKDGTPQSGNVKQFTEVWYKFRLDHPVPSITITLAALSGNPDLTVFFSNISASEEEDTHPGVLLDTSFRLGSDAVLIEPGLPGEYMVQVFGASDSAFTVVLSADQPPALQDGFGLVANVGKGKLKSFVVWTSPDQTADLTVSLTLFSGEAELYGGWGSPPNPTNHSYASAQYGSGALTIEGTELAQHADRKFYVSVYGISNSSFAILASFLNETQLSNGQPLSDLLESGESAFYRARLSAPTELLVTLTAIVGRCNLFVRLHNETAEQFRSEAQSPTQTLTFTSQQVTNACGNTWPCEAYIRAENAEDDMALYAIMTTTNATRLQVDVPQQFVVQEGSYFFFSFELTERYGVTFSVTPLSTGDSDLFVSTSVSAPTSFNNEWESQEFGADSITIRPSDPLFKLGVYHIGVLAFTSVSCSIRVTMDKPSGGGAEPNGNSGSAGGGASYMRLLDGAPEQVTIQMGPGDSTPAKRFFVFNVTAPASHTGLMISLTPSFGNPNLFVELGDSVSEAATWRSEKQGADSLVWGSAAGQPRLCNQTSCSYRILVTATESTSFTIRATLDQTPSMLSSGTGTLVEVSTNQWLYFNLVVTRPDQPLIVTSTSLSGDQDLHLSVGAVPPARDEIWPFNSENFGSDSIIIAHPQVTTYSIGLLGFIGGQCIVMATNGPIALVNGQPHDDTLAKQETRLYQLATPPDTDLDLTVSMRVSQGSPTVYVSQRVNPPPGPPNCFISSNACGLVWSSANASSTQAERNSLTIDHAEAERGAPFYVVVAAEKRTQAVYALTASYGKETATLLALDQPSTRLVQGGLDSPAMFRVNLGVSGQNEPQGVVTITSLSSGGTLTLCASTTIERPAPGDGPCVSATEPWLSIWGIKAWNLAVYSDSKERRLFSVVVAATRIHLSLGVPQTVALTGPSVGGGGLFFVLPLDLREAPTEPIRFSLLNATAKSVFALYVKAQPKHQASNELLRPSKDDHSWGTSDAGLQPGQALLILADDPTLCWQDCVYYLGLYLLSPPQHGSLDGVIQETASVLVSAEQGTDRLLLNVPLASSVPTHKLKYFEFYAPPAPAELIVTVEFCRGVADLYVSGQDYEPSEETGYATKDVSEHNIKVYRNAAPGRLAGNFYAGVSSQKRSTGAIFQITAGTDIKLPGPVLQDQTLTLTESLEGLTINFVPALPGSAPLSSYQVFCRQVASAKTNTGQSKDQKEEEDDRGLEARSFNWDSPCGLKLAGVPNATLAGSSATSNEDGTLSVTLSDVQPDNSYMINILVTDMMGNSVVYSSASLTVGVDSDAQRKAKKQLIWVLVTAIPVSLGLLVCVWRLRQVNKRLHGQLELEMDDVPRAAIAKAMQGPQSKRQGGIFGPKKYTRLLGFDDDDEKAAAPDLDPENIDMVKAQKEMEAEEL